MTVWHVETDFFALIIFVVMFIRNYIVKTEKNIQEKTFFWILIVSIVNVVIDIVTSLVMNDVTNYWLYEIMMVVYLLTVHSCIVAWVAYTLVLVYRENTKKVLRLMNIIMVPYLIYCLLVLSNPVTEWFFHLTKDVTYSRGVLFLPCGVGLLLLYSVMGIVIVIVNWKRIVPKSNIVLLSSFFGALMAAVVIQLMNPGWLIIAATYATVYVCCDFTIEEQNRKKLLLSLEQAVHNADEANAAKTSFLSRMSHDIRTPINGIMGMSALALDNENPQDTTECLKKIQGSCDFLLGLVNDTLDMTKVESGKIELHKSAYPVGEFEEYMKSIVEPMCEQKGIHLKTDVRATLVKKAPYVDKLRVNQIFFNLLSNAIKFTPEGGTVTIKIWHEPAGENEIYLNGSVSDTGIGMSEEFQKHMFETFTQEEQELLPQRQGSGLGLSIVKAMMDLMGGTIKVNSVVSKGTTFTICAKCELIDCKDHSAPNMQSKMLSYDYSLLDGKNVLLVEDHPLNQEIAVRLLKKIGINSVVAENGKRGVDLFLQSGLWDYDAVLMDMRMPVMDGLSATKAIRAMERQDAKNIPIIAMTANAFEDDAKECVKAGMNEHLAKPIVPTMLYDALLKYICIEHEHKDNVQKKVLVVDDVEVNAASIRAVLEKDYKVICTDNAKDALKILECEAGIAAVITDIQMPEMDGIELIRTIRKNREYDTIKLLANTQYGDSSQQYELLDAGADEFVYKATVPEILVRRLNSLLHA